MARLFNLHHYKDLTSLNIDDFYKTLAYAFLYKSLAHEVDGIPVNQRVCQELCVKKFSRLHHSAS